MNESVPPAGMDDNTNDRSKTVVSAMPTPAKSSSKSKSKLKSKSTTSPNLMTIATELRLQILEGVLISEKSLLRKPIFLGGPSIPSLELPRAHTAILSCCKQLHAEGLPIFYENTFIWESQKLWSKEARSMIKDVKLKLEYEALGPYGGATFTSALRSQLRDLAAVWLLEDARSLTIGPAWNYLPCPQQAYPLEVEGFVGSLRLDFPDDAFFNLLVPHCIKIVEDFIIKLKSIQERRDQRHKALARNEI